MTEIKLPAIDLTKANLLFERLASGLYVPVWQEGVAGAATVTKAIAGISTGLLANATATGTGFSTELSGAGLKAEALYVATLGADDTAAATATVTIYGSLVAMASANAADRVEIGTISLSGVGSINNDTVVDTGAITVGAHYWPHIWAEVTAISSGTGAKIQASRNV